MMRASTWFPYGLLVAWVICAISLAWSVSQEATNAVQVLYVAVIVMAIVALLVSLVSALGVAVGRFNRYWSSGFPMLFAAGLGEYGVFKASLEPTMIAILVVSTVVGYMTGVTIPTGFLRFVPIALVLAFLLLGELSVVPRQAKAAAMLLGFGLLIASLRQDRRGAVSDKRPGSNVD